MLVICRSVAQLNMEELTALYSLSADEFNDIAYERFLFDLVGFFAEKGIYAIWEMDGRYVSAARFQPFFDGWLLSSLISLKACRNHGYATTLIKSALEKLKLRPVYSHIERSNRASLSVHCKCNFQKCADYARLLDETVSSRYVTMVYN